MTSPGSFSDLLRKSRGVWLALAVVQTLAFGTGLLAGKRKWTSVPVLRTTKIFVLNRDLEYRVPGFGPWVAAGLKAAAIPFAVSGIVLLMGSYLEMMTLISASFR